MEESDIIIHEMKLFKEESQNSPGAISNEVELEEHSEEDNGITGGGEDEIE
jgi:hypothetical protein